MLTIALYSSNKHNGRTFGCVFLSGGAHGLLYLVVVVGNFEPDSKEIQYEDMNDVQEEAREAIQESDEALSDGLDGPMEVKQG